MNLDERIKKTNRGFNYVEITPEECFNWGGMCVCDSCNNQYTEENLYLVFVLGDCFCKECFNHWLERQMKYSEEDVQEDLKLQNAQSYDWYRYHLDKDFRDNIIKQYKDNFGDYSEY